MKRQIFAPRAFSLLLVAAALVGTGPLGAAELQVKLEVPQLNVAEYHRPYLALWLEKGDQSFVANLNVWYDLKKKDNGGAKWLKDLRQWWRKSGRELETPVDGVTSATRAVGEHSLSFSSQKAPFDKLPAGEYQVVLEMAREGGGRELLRLPMQWPPQGAKTVGPVKGKEEIGGFSLLLKP